MISLLNEVHNLETFELSSMTISTKIDVLLSVVTIEPENGIVEKACLLVSKLLTISRSEEIEYFVIEDIIIWLQKVLLVNQSLIKIILNTAEILIKSQFTADILRHLFCPTKTLLQQCVDHLLNEITLDSKECLKAVIQILNHLVNDLLNSFNKSEFAKIKILETVADVIIKINFSENIQLEISDFLFIPMFTIPILSKILIECTEYSELNTGDILGLINAYIHFDLQGQIKHPRKLLVSLQPIYNSLEETHDVKCQQSPGGKVSRTLKPRILIIGPQCFKIKHNLQTGLTFPTLNKQKTNFVDDLIIGEDSESGDDCCIQCLKIRLAALSLFKLLAKSLKNHIIYGYWHTFFPNNTSRQKGILHVVISDANAQCRIIALEIATQIIFGAKAFLKQAEIPKKSPTSYMPLCFSLGQMLQVMFNILNQALSTESSLSVLSNLLKCLAVLVQATPFHRMHCDIVGEFLPRIRKLLDHDDASIQFSALMVVEFLISTPILTKQICNLLGMPIQFYDVHGDRIYLCDSSSSDSLQKACSEEYFDKFWKEEKNSVETKEISKCDTWLLKIVMQKLHKRNHEQPSIRIKSLQVLSSMSFHFSMLIYNLEEIVMLLSSSLFDMSTDVTLCASKCLDDVAYNMGKYLLRNNSNKLLLCIDFWITMLPLAIEKISDKHQKTPVKLSLIDFLSNIGVVVFNGLPNVIQMNLLSFLGGIGSETDEDTVVRAAAVRALAVFVLFPSLKRDLVFVENTAELAVLLVSDRNLHVRIKSLWSIGNISDALVSTCGLIRNERISQKLLTLLIKVSLKSCNDNDKVRCNSVRALGNFMRLVSTDMLDDPYCRRLIQDVAHKLIYCVKASGNAKVKWNSCYAIGCAMKNDTLFIAALRYADFTWNETMFTTICNVIVLHTNYKVRINATNAITHISERSFYAQNFKLCWCSLMNALEESYDIIDFLEYNHRDYLQECLCIALCHIIRLASSEDFHEIRKEIEKREEIIKKIWFRVLNRMSPESAAPLLACPVLLQKRLKFESSLTEEQINSISLLTDIFCS